MGNNKKNNNSKTSKQQGGKSFNGVIKFPTANKEQNGQDISDDQIKALLMGVVKIIKQEAQKDANKINEQKLSVVNNKLKSTCLDACKKEVEADKLFEENNMLKKKVKLLEAKLKECRAKLIGERASLKPQVKDK